MEKVKERPTANVHPKDMTPEEREAFHENAEASIIRFKYEKPDLQGRPKKTVWMVKRPRLNFVVQYVSDGGENNLHYHTNSETSWMVLKGRARFVGPDDKIWADLDPMEGIHLPGGVRYRFHKLGEEDLEILQCVVIEEVDNSERVNIEAHKEWMTSPHLQKY